MAVRQLGRKLVGGWLGVARLPVDLATRVLPNGPTGPRAKVQIAVDKVDAGMRTTLGTVLRDQELQADGQRRRVAAKERGRAIELRSEAEATREDAKASVAEESKTAEKLRSEARAEAAKAKKATADEQAGRKARARADADQRERAVTEARDRVQGELEKEANRDRLEALEDETGALDAQADALTAADEANRLADAAADAKAARKDAD